jgi:hypothetical protein
LNILQVGKHTEHTHPACHVMWGRSRLHPSPSLVNSMQTSVAWCPRTGARIRAFVLRSDGRVCFCASCLGSIRVESGEASLPIALWAMAAASRSASTRWLAKTWGYLHRVRIFLWSSRKFDHLVLISEKSCAIGHYISSVSGCIEMINSEQRACLISWANFGALTKPRCDLCGEATFNAKSILILKIKILFGTYVGDNFNKIQSHKVQLERAPARLANPTISIQESRP